MTRPRKAVVDALAEVLFRDGAKYPEGQLPEARRDTITFYRRLARSALAWMQSRRTEAPTKED